MLVRWMVLLVAVVGGAVCVVTPKDVKLESQQDERNKTEEVEKKEESAKEPQAEGSARVSQQHYPEQHVRLQHLQLPHVQQQVGGLQAVLPAGLAGVPGAGYDYAINYAGAVRHHMPEAIQYQYYPVPVQVVPVHAQQIVPQQVVHAQHAHAQPQQQQQQHAPPQAAPQVQEVPSKTQEHYHTHLHTQPLQQEHHNGHLVHHIPPPPPPPSHHDTFVPSAGLPPHHEHGGGVFDGVNPHVHFPEPVDHHHHHPHDVAPVKNQNLRKVLVPLAGIALLGAAAALATNPVLLQLGVVSDVWRIAGRRRRSTQGQQEEKEVAALTLKDLAEIEDLGPGPEDISPFANLTSGVRLKEMAVLQKFLREQAKGTKRSYGQGDALLSSLLSCSGMLNPRNVACLQRLACEAYSIETDLPELEMQVLRIVVREMASHEAIPVELRKKVRMAVATGRKGKCEFTYRCPQKAWEKCINPNY